MRDDSRVLCRYAQNATHNALMRDAYMAALDDTLAADQRRTGTALVFDAALVDGRFRVTAALKLLPHLHDRSVLFMHDFWNRRHAADHVVDKFYAVIGRARSVVVLKRKPAGSLPRDWQSERERLLHMARPSAS